MLNTELVTELNTVIEAFKAFCHADNCQCVLECPENHDHCICLLSFETAILWQAARNLERANADYHDRESLTCVRCIIDTLYITYAYHGYDDAKAGAFDEAIDLLNLMISKSN